MLSLVHLELQVECTPWTVISKALKTKLVTHGDCNWERNIQGPPIKEIIFANSWVGGQSPVVEIMYGCMVLNQNILIMT
jgi:hypothetical protein